MWSPPGLHTRSDSFLAVHASLGFQSEKVCAFLLFAQQVFDSPSTDLKILYDKIITPLIGMFLFDTENAHSAKIIITALFPHSSSGSQEASPDWPATCTTGVSSWGSMETWAHTPVGATPARRWT